MDRGYHWISIAWHINVLSFPGSARDPIDVEGGIDADAGVESMQDVPHMTYDGQEGQDNHHCIDLISYHITR